MKHNIKKCIYINEDEVIFITKRDKVFSLKSKILKIENVYTNFNYKLNHSEDLFVKNDMLCGMNRDTIFEWYNVKLIKDITNYLHLII